MLDFINEIFLMTCIFTLKIPQETHNLKLLGVKTCELGLYYLLFRHSGNRYIWSGFSIADIFQAQVTAMNRTDRNPAWCSHSSHSSHARAGRVPVGVETSRR